MEAVRQKSGISFQGHPLGEVEERVVSFIERHGFPVVGIVIHMSEKFDAQGTEKPETLTCEILLSEPITEQERYRLTQGLDHHVHMGITAEDMTILPVEKADTLPDSLEKHAEQLRLRILGALDHDVVIASKLGGRGQIFKIQLAPVGFFRKLVNKKSALDLLLPAGDLELQNEVLEIARSMDAHSRIVRVGLRRARLMPNFFKEEHGGVVAH